MVEGGFGRTVGRAKHVDASVHHLFLIKKEQQSSVKQDQCFIHQVILASEAEGNL